METNEPRRYHKLALLISVGFFVNCQPSEAFLTSYLEDVKGLTDEQLGTSVWPYDTYGTFIFLLPMGLLAEIFGYRTTIFLGILCREATRVILIYGEELTAMSVMQLTYAAGYCANTVYFAYVYMVLPTDQFVLGTGIILSAYHVGNSIGSLIGQVMVQYGGAPLVNLFYVSWAFTTVGLLCFFWMPDPVRPAPPSLVSVMRERGLREGCQKLGKMYSARVVVMWSFWWFFGNCVHLIIGNYFQTQFKQIDRHTKMFGYFEAGITLFNSIGSMLPNVTVRLCGRCDCKKTTEPNVNVEAIQASQEEISKVAGESWLTDARAAALVVSILCALVAVSYFSSTLTALHYSVWWAFTFNCVAGLLFQFLLSAASSGIASRLDMDRTSNPDSIDEERDAAPRYSMVFVMNTFCSLALSSIFQAVATVYKANVTDIFVACSIVYASLAVVFLAIALGACLCCTRSEQYIAGRENYTVIAN